MTDKQQIYYHFVSANKRLCYDLADVEVHVGLHLKTDQEIKLCDYGYHASKNALDALRDAPFDAEWLCGVTLGGSIIHGDDKSVATERTVIWMLNVRKVLVEFAAWNAEQAFEVVRGINLEPDQRSIEAVRIARLWLAGKATNEEVAAAADAARAAADAADTAARAADATVDATRTAAHAASHAADTAADAADTAVDAANAAVYAADAARAVRAAAYAAAHAADTTYAARAAVYAARTVTYKAQSAKLEELIAAALKVQGE